MKKYKIFTVKDSELISPFQNYPYGKFEDIKEKELISKDFDNSNQLCSNGFYATDIDGLIYTNLSENKKVFEVEVSGKQKIFDTYKQRFETLKIIRLIPDDELHRIVKEQSDKMDWDYYHALFPVNPLNIPVKPVTQYHIDLLKEWDSVGTSIGDSVKDSVWDSVGTSIGDSVWSSIGDSVWNSIGNSIGTSVWSSIGDSVWSSIGNSVWSSVGDSVGDSVGAYISSLFPNIEKWKYIEHEKGVNPFQSAIDLWHEGMIPYYDGKEWKIYQNK